MVMLRYIFRQLVSDLSRMCYVDSARYLMFVRSRSHDKLHKLFPRLSSFIAQLERQALEKKFSVISFFTFKRHRPTLLGDIFVEPAKKKRKEKHY